MYLNHETYHHLFDLIAPVYELYKCEECRCVFVEEEHLAMHLQLHKQTNFQFETYPMIDVIFVCVYCNLEFHTNYEKVIHMKTCNQRKYICDYCGKNFFQKQIMTKHLRIHAGSLVYSCEICGKSASNSHDLQTHLRSHSTDFPCYDCGLMFKDNKHFMAHKKCHQLYDTITPHINLPKCEECPKCFFRKSDLIPHLKLHVGLLAFSCEICGKKTKDNNDLKIHMRSHTSETPYKCSLCPKAYKTVSGRSSHMETHKESSHECSLCEKTFKRRDIFKRHMRMVHDEKYRGERLAENTCTLCDTAFLKKFHFINHMKVNHNVIIPAGAASSLNQSNS
ncbi:unnamed protein product [Diamesa hyperborea]